MKSKEIKAREMNVKSLREKYGDIKIILLPENEDEMAESLWVVPKSQQGLDIAKDDSSKGDKFIGVLLNQPIAPSWAAIKWGEEVMITSDGKNKPYALIQDNFEDIKS